MTELVGCNSLFLSCFEMVFLAHHILSLNYRSAVLWNDVVELVLAFFYKLSFKKKNLLHVFLTLCWSTKTYKTDAQHFSRWLKTMHFCVEIRTSGISLNCLVMIHGVHSTVNISELTWAIRFWPAGFWSGEHLRMNRQDVTTVSPFGNSVFEDF